MSKQKNKITVVGEIWTLPIDNTGETTTRLLPVPMTEAEELKLGQDVADLKLSINKIEIEKKVTVQDFNKKIGGMEGRLDEMIQQLKDRTKQQEVNCTWMLNDPRDAMKSLYRDDTKERLETYEMTLFDSDDQEEKKDDGFVPDKKKK